MRSDRTLSEQEVRCLHAAWEEGIRRAGGEPRLIKDDSGKLVGSEPDGLLNILLDFEQAKLMVGLLKQLTDGDKSVSVRLSYSPEKGVAFEITGTTRRFIPDPPESP